LTVTEPLPPEVRIYEVVRLTGWTLDQIDEAPAQTLDWLLAIERTHRKVEASSNDG
jgi:hypothetical protein